MATKKQRRRRAKEQRHDYVWVDDEGNEIDAPDGTPDKSETRGRSPRRDPQAPSWQRTFKRSAIFAPIMFGTVLLLSPAQLGELVADETEKWGKVIRAANIKAE